MQPKYLNFNYYYTTTTTTMINDYNVDFLITIATVKVYFLNYCKSHLKRCTYSCQMVKE